MEYRVRNKSDKRSECQLLAPVNNSEILILACEKPNSEQAGLL